MLVVAIEVHESAHRRADEVRSRVFGIWPILAEVRDAHEDDAGVRGRQRGVVEPKFTRLAGRVGLDHDIADCSQAMHDLPAGLEPELAGHRALAGVLRQK